MTYMYPGYRHLKEFESRYQEKYGLYYYREGKKLHADGHVVIYSIDKRNSLHITSSLL